MLSGSYHFDNFSLEPADRQLKRDNVPLELNARYFDALALLVREHGKLVSKDRFLEEVWRGIPVTDEALTQCIKTIRKQLGDSAGSPRFIETVPKHGYRFITPVEWVAEVVASGVASTSTADAAPMKSVDGTGMAATAKTLDAVSPATIANEAATIQATTNSAAPASIPLESSTARNIPEVASGYSWQQFFMIGGAGTLGGAIAGILGGLFFGLVGVSQTAQAGMGAVSVLLVFFCLTILLGVIGGAGVSFGIAAAGFASDRAWHWSIVGGAMGGMIIGAIVKMLGLDTFNLLFGQSPGDITGALEGALLGGAIGFGLWLGGSGAEANVLKRSIIAATIAGGVVGIIIPLLGGRLMGGSLDLLARSFPNSRLRLDHIGNLFGETDFGLITQIVTASVEGAVFCGCIVAAMLVLRTKLRK